MTGRAAPSFLLPGEVDDPTVPSGGNVYGRRVCRELPARAVPIEGSWPRPERTARAELACALRAEPDGAVVLLDGLVACGVPDIVVPQARRLRLVVLVHLPLGDETGLPAELAARLDAAERATLRAVPAVVATSRWAAGRLVEHHGLEAERVHTVEPGTDPAPLAHGTDGRSRLLCVAAVTPRKGLDLLAEALSGVADQRWTCACVGATRRDPGHTTRLRGLIERHGLGDRMTLAGPRAGAELAACYAAADLLVLPSRAETYGMVVTEALARGVPVLATAVDGVPQALGLTPDGDLPGMLVPPDDPAALGAALREWFARARLRHHLRVAARRRRGTLRGWEVTAQRLAGVLAGLRGEPGRAA
ncbi:glycosyltransferase family 4 protein [Amycolatopsis aidingensis]|uniref:glycosyltransferase family 4 protein n=1 Tax=Amycolatopsis aidingensis TaxID=2842453 RepID=UPI001C0C4F9D|nr:glycosyltransferase family 4 protein [Amycolatopsis aidingensis]